MLRVKWFAAAMDMIAEGTRAPMAMAEYATPANQLGKFSSNRWGTASWALAIPSVPKTDVPAAIAEKPSSASRPSISEYRGRNVALRRMTLRLRPERTAVMECGYMNNARAEPKASDA